LNATSSRLLADVEGDAWSAGGWANYRWTPTPRFTITPGVRFERWQLFDQSKVSPWLLTDFELRPGTRLRASAGVQHQAATIDHSFGARPNQPLVPERAVTVEAGIEKRIGAAWRVNVTAFRRRDEDRLRVVNGEIRIENNRVVLPANAYWANVMTGETTGAEVVLERRSASGLNGWLSYSWNDSTLEDDARAGHLYESFPSDFDQRHTVNAYMAYRWGGRTSLSLRYRYGSNFPITGYVGQDALGYTISAQRNGVRLPEYARLDLRADRTFTYQKSRLTLFVEVVNAMNRDNVRFNSPGYNTGTRRVFNPTEPLFPLLPVAGVLIEF
jgi:outer membrane receptor for ferrienterochelin and colicin